MYFYFFDQVGVNSTHSRLTHVAGLNCSQLTTLENAAIIMQFTMKALKCAVRTMSRTEKKVRDNTFYTSF